MFKRLVSKVGEVAKQTSEQIFNSPSKNTPTARFSVVDFERLWEAIQVEYEAVVQACYDANPDSDPNKVSPELIGSKLPSLLHRLVQALEQEDKLSYKELVQAQGGSMDTYEFENHAQGPLKPCIEYMMEHRVWEKLCAMGMVDEPQGIMVLVIQTVYRLLERIRHPLLPYKAAHQPLVQLIRVCSEVGNEQVQSGLVNLLQVVWRKMRQDPSQIQFFISPGQPNQSSTKSLPSERFGPASLIIFNTLLPFIQWDNKVGEKAREAVLIAAALGDDDLTDYMVNNTDTSIDAARGLASSYVDVPNRRGKEDDMLRGEIVGQVQVSYRSFRNRILFCNALCMAHNTVDTSSLIAMSPRHRTPPSDFGASTHAPEAPTDAPSLAASENPVCEQLLRQLEEVFLSPILGPGLLDADPSNRLHAISLTTFFIETLGDLSVESPLLVAVVQFLIGEFESDVPGEPDGPIFDALVQHLAQGDQLLSEATLRLFHALVNLNDPRIIHKLVLLPLLCGTHLEKVETALPDEPSVFRRRLADIAAIESEQGDSRAVSVATYTNDIEAQTLHRISALVANTSKLKQYRTAYPGGTKVVAQQLFLSALLGKLSNLLQNSMAENVLLTGIFTSLAQFPFRILESFLLDEPIQEWELDAARARVPVFDCRAVNPAPSQEEPSPTACFKNRPDQATLVTILDGLWDTANREVVQQIPNFEQALSITKQQLGVDIVDLQDAPPSSQLHVSDNDAAPMLGDVLQPDLAPPSRKLQGYIVLDEFVKELCCVVLAKKNLKRNIRRLMEDPAAVARSV